MSEDEYWDCIKNTLFGPNGWTPNLLLDDGGAITRALHDYFPEYAKRSKEEIVDRSVRRVRM